MNYNSKFFIYLKSVKNKPQFDIELRSSVGTLASIAPPNDIGMSPPGGLVILLELFGDTPLELSVAYA